MVSDWVSKISRHVAGHQPYLGEVVWTSANEWPAISKRGAWIELLQVTPPLLNPPELRDRNVL